MYINQNKQAEKKDNEPAKPQRILSPEQKNTGGQPATAEMGKTMTWMMPIFTLWITTTLPSAMGIYWTASNVFSVVQNADADSVAVRIGAYNQIGILSFRLFKCQIKCVFLFRIR